MPSLSKGVNIVLDAQWGSVGKGKLCGMIGTGMFGKVDLACSSFGPNAGHTHVDDEGRQYVFHMLPSSCVTAKCPALIMPDSVIRTDYLFKEAAEAGVPVFVHPRAAVLCDEDAVAARETGRHIAGTMQGTGHAMARKMLRLSGAKLAKDVLPAEMIADTCQMVRDACRDGRTVLFEMAQGFDLSLNHGHDWPYLTSRDITVGAALNSLGVSHRCVGSVIGAMRCYPIRVGNVDGGWSGPHHPDQTEMTWPEVTKMSGSPTELLERTTVTKRVRRVFSFSLIQLRRFIEVNAPDWMFLNFVQYLDAKAHGATDIGSVPPGVMEFVAGVERETGVKIAILGTGKHLSESVVL